MPETDTKKLPVKQVYHDLKSKIISGEYNPGEFMPDLKKLQAQYGASLPIINEALELLAEEKILTRNSPRFKVSDSSQEDQLPHKLKYIAVVIAEIDDFSQIVFNRLEVECRKRSLELLFYRHEMDNDLQRRQYERASLHKNTLIILFPNGPYCSWLQSSSHIGRTIIVDEAIPGAKAPQILSDDDNGMYKLTKYLIELGHRHIAHICAEDHSAGYIRHFGYRRALEASGLNYDPTMVSNGKFQIQASMAAFEQLLKAHPEMTACLCANDYSALGAIEAMRKLKLTPGKDISLAGYGNFAVSEAIDLTTVDQQIGKICNQAAYMIDQYRTSGKMPPGIYPVPTELVIRGSCVRLEQR
jgi:GntR family transcriptional regulator of arabinose operon